MSKVFFISGNAGQGKSSVCANLALVLRSFGFDVLLVDADLKSPRLGHLFGVPLVERTIQGVSLGLYSVESAVFVHPSGLKLLLSGLSVVDCPHPVRLLSEFERVADVVIVDVPSFDSGWLSSKRDVVLVCHNDFPSVLDARKFCSFARGVVVNRFVQGDLSANSVRDVLSCDVFGSIPESSVFREALRKGCPVVDFCPDSEVSVSFKCIAAKLMNLKYSPPVKRVPFLARLGLVQ